MDEPVVWGLAAAVESALSPQAHRAIAGALIAKRGAIAP
jgi:hypothetical protein